MSAACAQCLSRTWLIARLAGAIEIARHEKRRLRELLALPEEQLIARLGGKRATEIAHELEHLDIDALREAVASAGLEAACRHDPGYPARLADLRDAPAVLFVAGGAQRLSGLVGAALHDGPPAIAIVGTRRASPDGAEVARALGRGVAAGGVTVVSGMALGIDSAAHAGALDVGAAVSDAMSTDRPADGARTVAVLAGGADVPYPPSKARLHRMITERGCVVSELPPGFVALRWCFPARNRIIAGLAHMTIVVEAAQRSGSLITAEIATDLGREVGAVPGPVSAWRSAGTNGLLRDGATVIRNARDALDSVLGTERHDSPAPDVEPRLRDLLLAVGDGHDTLAALTRGPADVASTLAALTELELLGHLRRVAGGRYVVIPQ